MGPLLARCYSPGTLPVKYDQAHLSVPFAEHIAPILRAELAAAGLL